MRTSVKCPECRFANWSDAENCKRCLAPLAPQPSFGAFNPMHRKLDDMSYPSYSSYTPGSSAGGRVELAGRLRRLIGAIIDSILLSIPLGFIDVSGMLIANALELPAEQSPTIGMGMLSFWLFYFFTFVIIQVYLLMTQGQTIAKKLLGMRIVKHDTHEVGGFVATVLVRYVLTTILSFIPLFGLIDTLFIFREDRRCLHDLMAGTVVVKA